MAEIKGLAGWLGEEEDEKIAKAQADVDSLAKNGTASRNLANKAAAQKKRAASQINAQNINDFQFDAREAQTARKMEENRATAGYGGNVKGSGMLRNLGDFIGANVDDYQQKAQEAYRENYTRKEGEDVVGFGSKTDLDTDTMGRMSFSMFDAPSDKTITTNFDDQIAGLRTMGFSPSELVRQEAKIKQAADQSRARAVEAKMNEIQKVIDLERAQREKAARDKLVAAEQAKATKGQIVSDLDAQLTQSFGDELGFQILSDFNRPQDAQAFLQHSGADSEFGKYTNNMRRQLKSVPTGSKVKVYKLWGELFKKAKLAARNGKPVSQDILKQYQSQIAVILKRASVAR